MAYALLVCVQSAILSQLVGGEEASYYNIASALALPVLLVTIYANVAISVKRLHDIGYSGFLALAILIPIVNLAFSIWAGVLPGTPAANAYGDAPDTPPA